MHEASLVVKRITGCERMVVFILQDKYVVCDNQALFTLERIYSGINVIFAPKKSYVYI